MTIQKYLHSCLILQKDEKRLLIDPGIFSFIEGQLKPADLGAVDVILLTHNHADHFDPKILEEILAQKSATIVTIPEIGRVLEEHHIPYQLIEPGQQLELAGFKVQGIRAPHGSLPVPVPENIGFLVDNVFHPGDSYEPSVVPVCDILALPVAGPWLNLNQALALVDAVKPKRILPIHDAILKDFMRKRIYDGMLKTAFESRQINFHPLELGDTLKA